MKPILFLSFFFLSGCVTYKPAMSAYTMPNYHRIKSFCEKHIRGNDDQAFYEQEVCYFAITDWEWQNEHYEVKK